MDVGVHARACTGSVNTKGGFHMKAKVLKGFKDKYSGKLYKAGQTIIISKDRYAEILKVAPLIEEVKDPKAKNAE